jgi:hypothetical protein
MSKYSEFGEGVNLALTTKLESIGKNESEENTFKSLGFSGDLEASLNNVFILF